MEYYMVISADGNELTTGVSEYEIDDVAQSHADRLGATVYVSSSDGEVSDRPVSPSPVAAAERALGIEIGRTSGGRLYYTADDEGTLTGYYLTRADLAYAVECRRAHGRDAYSHWCAGTVTRRMSPAALARATA